MRIEGREWTRLDSETEENGRRTFSASLWIVEQKQNYRKREELHLAVQNNGHALVVNLEVS